MESLPRSDNRNTPHPATPMVGGVPCIFCSKWHRDSGGEQSHLLVDHKGGPVSTHYGKWVPISVCYSRNVINDSDYPYCRKCLDWFGLAYITVCPLCDKPMVVGSQCPHCRSIGDVV